MTKFEKAIVPPEEIERVVQTYAEAWRSGNPTIRAFLPKCSTLAEAKLRLRHYVTNMSAQTTYRNDTYQVVVHDLNADMVHLSIKRIDRAPIHDWRELQQIKNELVGPENEAVEMYPAESRKIDSANQFHLWCLKDATSQFPWGFDGVRAVQEDSIAGSVQRPLEEEHSDD